MHAALVLNPRAGSLNGERDAVAPEKLIEALRAAGVPATLHLTAPAKLPETLVAAIREQPATLFVGGGDGTIGTAAAHLADTGIALGVLPMGTLNHFAHDLGIPADWRAAVAALAGGERRTIDLGEVNGRVFINNCSIGSYAEAVRRRDALRRERGSGKAWAMIVATLATFRHLRRLRGRIAANGATTAFRTPFILVANNRYSGHVLAPRLRPQLDAGRLWVYTTHAGGRLALLHLGWQSLVRRIDRADALDALEVAEAEIALERTPAAVAVDGELVKLDSPLRFRTRPGALTVLAPRKKSAAAS